MKKVLKIFGKIFASIYSIIFFGLLMCFTTLIFISTLFEKDYYETIINKIDFSKVDLTEIGIEFANDKITNLEDFLVDKLKDADIDRETIQKTLNNKELKEELSEFTSKYLKYTINSDEIPQLELEDIKEICYDTGITRKIENYVDENGEKLNADKYITEMVDTFNDKIRENLNNQDIKKKIEESGYTDALKVLETENLLVALIVFLVVSYLILAFLTWSLYLPLSFMGIPAIINGILLIICWLGIDTIIGGIVGKLSNGIMDILKVALRPALYIGLISLIAGIIFLVLRIVIAKNIKASKEEEFDFEGDKNEEPKKES